MFLHFQLCEKTRHLIYIHSSACLSLTINHVGKSLSLSHSLSLLPSPSLSLSLSHSFTQAFPFSHILSHAHSLSLSLFHPFPIALVFAYTHSVYVCVCVFVFVCVCVCMRERARERERERERHTYCKRHCHRKIESATRVQILDKADCISGRAQALRKSKNQSVLPISYRAKYYGELHHLTLVRQQV